MKRILTLAILFTMSISALDAAAAADLSKIRFGEHVTGPEVTDKELKKRFVIVEYWGINCPPCIASIPGITKLAEDYGHDKLVVVAMHRQGGTNDKVKEVWEARASSNHVAVFNGGDLPGFGNGGIPNSILFDPYGRELYRGSPSGLKNALKDAMRNFRPIAEEKPEEAGPPPIVSGVEAKYFKRELDTINEQERRIDSTLRNIRRVVERSSREDQVAEGQAILDALGAWASEQQAEAESAKSSDPATAYVIAEKAVDMLGRDELGEPFIEMKREMERDDKLMDTIRSRTMLREIKAQAEAIGLIGDKSSEFNADRHARELRMIARDLRRMAGVWPDTDAGKEAEALLKEWDLDR